MNSNVVVKELGARRPADASSQSSASKSQPISAFGSSKATKEEPPSGLGGPDDNKDGRDPNYQILGGRPTMLLKSAEYARYRHEYFDGFRIARILFLLSKREPRVGSRRTIPRPRRSIVTAARHEVLLSWTARDRVLRVQWDLLHALTTVAANTASLVDTTGYMAQAQNESSRSGRTTGRLNQYRPNKRKKAQRNDEQDDDSEDDPDTRDFGPPELLIIYPCCWYDRETFSWRNRLQKEYRNCEAVELHNIARLKQHLGRVHKRPGTTAGSAFPSSTAKKKSPSVQDKSHLVQSSTMRNSRR
ncbi:uncharacterized protein Z519_01179 [Cladophialophora bantiana CBS 173.52]|uniref:Uncharacterized protein n=1 Tax=Cladophialophora bantiana (strain ATCC 10958 / CBS 173.52 / CDC B-1940 / NIH 8579) TaxID=1442370 RepID=A0A0D2I333_CLAB1|nr:uncharacterized protein Z519_01179 [Cladophialophora bantiana CBS 173.52]KIW97595.1 hypothetical protein Z519_01179 [Cladophialophora bantiana CBS 173.52]